MRDTAEMQGVIPEALLVWYDTHARQMPWRVGPQARQSGHRPNPYHVWLSEIMLQQTTVAAVRDYFIKFTHLWPQVTDLAAADDADVMAAWAGLGYYARARNLLKCARVVVDQHGGLFPDTEEALLALPGIGPYTAAAIAAIAFDRHAVVMDGNVERVMARLFAVQTPLPRAKPELKSLAQALTPNAREGDYAQSVMDLGATICTPRSPACGICPVIRHCAARRAGIPAQLPRKEIKKPKPTRVGHIFVAYRADGAVLIEQRPEKGLLGGMLGFITSPWLEVEDATAPIDVAIEPPLHADWRDIGGELRHTFTHFHLRLRVHVARLPLDATPTRGAFCPQAEFRVASMPSVMRKAYDLAHPCLRDISSQEDQTYIYKK